MDQNPINPYTTEIPVTDAEKQIAQAQTPTAQPTPPAPSQPGSATPPPQTPPPVAPPQQNGAPLPPPPKMHTSIVPKLIIAFLIIAILGLSGYIVSNKTMTKPIPTPTPVVATPTPLPTATPTPLPDVATTSADPSSTRFYSKDLGILFDTAKNIPASTATIDTKVVGSRVYVYGSTTQYTTGQYIDVLSKLSTDDVATAAQKITQGDPNYKNCTFSISPQTVYPATYQMAQPTCPASHSSGLSFFLTDSDNPTKLLFVSIGQYAMPATSNPQTKWQDTIRFLPQ